MTEFTETSPRMHSSVLDPFSDPVMTAARPNDYRELLTERDFAEQPWNTSFGAGRFFYLTGVTDAMRLLQEKSGTFLKLKGHLDAILVDEDLERWGTQSGIRLDEKIKRERAGEITVPKPTYFYKCVECLVAFEHAFENSERLKDKVSKFWVFDYMRIVPAIYNIRQFNTNKLDLLRRDYEDFDRLALEATYQPDPLFLDDLANGKTVTRPTAYRLKIFINTHCNVSPDHAVGEVRIRPGNHGLGDGPATTHEIVEPIITPDAASVPDVDAQSDDG